MPTVFEEHRVIIEEKTREYQEALKKRIEAFNKCLDTYWEQVKEYEKWGELKHLHRYKKKASILDNK
jgi:dynein heavy chain, axonemal